MKMQTVEDLLDHASEQIKQTISRVGDLFEDDAARDIFMLTLYARFLNHACICLYDGDEEERAHTRPEPILTTAFVLASQIHGKESINDLDQGRMTRRARAILLKLRAAARQLDEGEAIRL